jgi:hypothetical protein
LSDSNGGTAGSAATNDGGKAAICEEIDEKFGENFTA